MGDTNFKWNSNIAHAFVKLYADTFVADVRIFDQDPDYVSVTGKEMAYIICIATIKNCTAKDLVKLFGVSKSMVSQVISHLEEKKLVVRRDDEEDRRVHIITLSPSCTAELSKKINIIEKAVDKIRDKFSEEELQSATKVFTELSIQMIGLGIELGNVKKS